MSDTEPWTGEIDWRDEAEPRATPAEVEAIEPEVRRHIASMLLRNTEWRPEVIPVRLKRGAGGEIAFSMHVRR
jgi:hypothetical protein